MDLVLEASHRDTTERAASLRKNGWVPGCIYGKNVEPINFKVPKLSLEKCLRHHSAKFYVNVDNQSKYLVGIEEVQRGALQDQLIHISLLAMNENEKATLHVEVEFVGKAKGQMMGGVIKENVHDIAVRGYPATLPDKLVVAVNELEIGDQLHVSDIADQYDFEFLKDDMDKILVSCGHPKVQKIPTAEEIADEVSATTEPNVEEKVETEEAA